MGTGSSSVRAALARLLPAEPPFCAQPSPLSPCLLPSRWALLTGLVITQHGGCTQQVKTEPQREALEASRTQGGRGEGCSDPAQRGRVTLGGCFWLWGWTRVPVLRLWLKEGSPRQGEVSEGLVGQAGNPNPAWAPQYPSAQPKRFSRPSSGHCQRTPQRPGCPPSGSGVQNNGLLGISEP